MTDYSAVEIKLHALLNSSGLLWTESGANHDVNEHHQIKGLISKTKAVQVCSVNLCTFHSCPLQNNTSQRKIIANAIDEYNC